MKTLRVYIVGLCSVFAVFVYFVAMNSLAMAGGEDMKVFRSYLLELGSRLDCYFTVESVGLAGSLNNPILDAMVDGDATGVQDVDSALAFLTNQVRIVWKDASKTHNIQLVADKVECAKTAKTVIRIRDARLLDVVGYSLTNKVSVAYEGNPDGLLNLLSSQNSLIQPQKTFSIGMGPIVVDAETHVEATVTNVNVRDLLTSCIPLAGYNRIIWSCYTDGKAEFPVVTIKFKGESGVSP